VNSLNKEGEGFDYLRQKFLSISENQDKRRHFRRSSSKTAFPSPHSKNKLNAAERRVWDEFEKVCSNFGK
jgi:hypothetical protein